MSSGGGRVGRERIIIEIKDPMMTVRGAGGSEWKKRMIIE